MISATRLSSAFVEIADSLVADYDVVDFLAGLTAHAAEVSGAAAVGLLLADNHDQLHYMASSNESGKLLELFQLQNSEGPCWDCYHQGAPVVNAELGAAAARWPHFAPGALARGFHSVHAVPLRCRDQVIGAIGLFGTKDVRFDDDEVKVVQALADVATIAILQERNLIRAETLTEQLQGALTSRTVIEQAKGVLVQLEGIDPDQAFDQLRQRARSSSRRLTDVAREVIDRAYGGARVDPRVS